MAHAGLDLGNVLQQVESIRGQRATNALSQQSFQQNALAQQGSNQFNALLQQHFANPTQESFNAIAAVSPEAASQIQGLTSTQQTQTLQQQKIEQQNAKVAVAGATNLVKSADPATFAKIALPQLVEEMRKNPDIDVDSLTNEDWKRIGNEIITRQTPIAQSGLETKTFAPTTIIGPEGNVQRVIPQVSGTSVTNIPVGQAPVLDPEAAAELALRSAESAADIKTRQALEQSRGLNKEQREDKFITEAFAAAGEIQDIRRAQELIEIVNTSGFEASKLAITDFFGTTPGDVGEFRRLAAQNVLDGLAAFTGAISEGERAFLERISTNIAQGKEVNKRNLARLERIATNAIDRGRTILERRGDAETLELFNQSLGEPTQEGRDTGRVTATGGRIIEISPGNFVVRE